MNTLTYNNVHMPVLGFGTWQMKGQECQQAIGEALHVGYRHIDTAQAYENEEDVGQALQSSSVPRSEIFLTTKVWMDQMEANRVKSSTEESLSRLQTDYVDLLLVHWPVEDVPFEETLRAFEDLQSKGKTRLIGVSNFTVDQMEQCREEIGADIAVNQVEYHPSISQKPVLEYIRDKKMILTAYSPLGRGEEIHEQVVKDMAASHDKTPGQIILRWLIQQEHVSAIPKAASKEHISQNLDIFDFELSPEEMQTIHDLARPDGRIVDPDWAPDWDTARAA
jgi:diketogulonate reductase-like aldo/keto reductase